MNGDYGYDPDREVEELYTALTARPAFRYSPGDDPLYRSYADRYIENGRRAMRDAQGQAAALTGGYGSSYAQGVGQQRYDDYLRSLGEALPELYGLAWQRYSAEGDALRDAYDRSWERREDAYRRGRDALEDERYEAGQRAAAEQQAYRQRQDSYAQLYKLIASTGYQPTDAELQGAGLSRAQAEALRYEYLRQNGLLAPAAPASGGAAYYGGGSSKSGSSKSSGTAKSTKSGSASKSATAAVTAQSGVSLTGGGGKRVNMTR